MSFTTETPRGIRIGTSSKDSPRWYEVNSERVPSVTTILSSFKSLPPAWGSKVTREGVIDIATRYGWIEDGLPPDFSEKKLAEWLKREGHTTDAVGKRGRDRGSATHDILGYLLQGHPTPPVESQPENVRPYIEAITKWHVATQPELIELEFYVGSPEYLYAGRADAIVKIDGTSYLIDLKTGAKLYPEVSLQLAAYHYAAYQSGYPQIDKRMAILAKEDGTYETRECGATFEEFVPLIQAYHVLRKGERLFDIQQPTLEVVEWVQDIV